jgi:hypothetical protein
MNASNQGQCIPTPIPPNYPPSATSGPSNMKCEEKLMDECDPVFYENFSKSILRMRLQEYFSGKYTQRYIETYLEFVHLSGMINNLDYLEFKNILIKGEL